MTIKGIDAAYWEPVINWYQVISAGYRFAFIKASQANFTDPKFTTHWANARAAGMPRGAYHFYDPSKSPESQAEYFWNLVRNDPGELPFVVDFEAYTSGPYFGSNNWYRYLTRLNQLSNNHPAMIYTAYYYWNDNVGRPPAVLDMSYFAQYPLWVANYNTTSPLVPAPWTWWMFWQYSESGIVPGVMDELGRPTECDLDYFFGTEEQFQALLKGDWVPPNSNGGNTVSTFYKATGNITIRTGPSTSYPQVATGEKYVLTNDIVETTVAPKNGFVNIANIYRGDVKMAVAIPAWCGSAYLQVTNYTPPTPPTEITLTHTIQVYSDGSLWIDGNPYV